MTNAVKIGVTGCTGRMGRELVAAVLADERAELAGGSVRPGAEMVGEPVLDAFGRATGLTITDDAPALVAGSDVVIDFSAPDGTASYAELVAESGTGLVIGTTGLGPEAQSRVNDAARRTPVLQAANFSLGVAVLAKLVQDAAARLGADFDIEIQEMHHRYKADAPSGTARALGHAAGEGRGLAHSKIDAAADDLNRAGPRAQGAIGFSASRGGDVAGEHTVTFAGGQERLELTHRATSRTIFANGAVAAALWLADQGPGKYTLDDVLKV